MKKKSPMLIFSLAILIALAGCKKDVSKDLSITTAAGPQQNKQPNLPPSTGDNAQSKLPNQVTPLLADPYSPGHYYFYYGDVKFVFSDFVYPAGPLVEGDPISSCCGVSIDGAQGIVTGYNLGVLQNEVVAKMSTWCDPPNFYADGQAYQSAVSNYMANRDTYIQQQMQLGVSYSDAFNAYEQNNVHPMMENYITNFYSFGSCSTTVVRFKMIRIASGTTYGVVMITGAGAS
jgi:hypothetical protein